MKLKILTVWAEGGILGMMRADEGSDVEIRRGRQLGRRGMPIPADNPRITVFLDLI